MTCKDAIDVLVDDLDATCRRAVGRELEEHLTRCAPCQAYLNTYKRTAELGREAGRVEMPAIRWPARPKNGSLSSRGR